MLTVFDDSGTQLSQHSFDTEKEVVITFLPNTKYYLATKLVRSPARTGLSKDSRYLGVQFSRSSHE
ncbi:MAG: hypothetical protein KDD70_08640 [Bdellovibrionales bacterium]|nr:hypothetical protein [Bdellovibrionales bacterium]